MLCPKCSSPNLPKARECEVCGVVFAHAKKVATDFSRLCVFLDLGKPCEERGILSSSQNGSGAFYCRQHWAIVNGVAADVVGNELPPQIKSRAVEQWHKGKAA